MIVGLIGRAGSGKTHAQTLIKAHFGCWIIDLDQLGHYCLGLDFVKARLVDQFGAEIMTDAGQINRSNLAEKVFSEKASLTALNRIIHPVMKEQVVAQLEPLQGQPGVIVGAVLLEIGLRAYCDYIVVIDAEDDAIFKQSGNRAIRAHSSQRSRDEYRHVADDIVKNTFDDAFKKNLLSTFENLAF